MKNPGFTHLVHPLVADLTTGYIASDVAGVTGNICYAPIVDTSGFWKFSSPSATVNGQTIQRPSGNTAVADTGTTLCLVDSTLCEAIYGAIPGATYAAS